MKRRTRCRLPVPFLVGLVLGLAGLAPVAHAELYRWIDGDGGVRYATSQATIPSGYRDDAQPVTPGMAMPAPEPEPEPEAAATATSTLPSVIGAPVPDPSPRLGHAGLPAPGPTAVADASPSDPPADAAKEESADLDARIRELEEAIARDEATLKDIISTPPKEGDEGIESSAELREIARRLPGMQAELRALRQQQAVQGP